jgi:peptide-methionine (S)-S-oxide reductase
MTTPTEQGRHRWRREMDRLRWWWWFYLALALAGTTLFLRSLHTPDPYLFAVLLLISLLSLRQAWRIDREIRRCKASTEPRITDKEIAMSEKATFAAGCFWGVEEMFRTTPGVISTRVGYIGGKTLNPTYEQVCSDRTGHAEAVEIQFDPKRVSFQKLLELFFENHDPTTLDRQGPDVGSQYRSGVFFHSPEQEKSALAEIEKRDASGDYDKRIVTEVVPAGEFYSAEDYHQKYFHRRGANWSCHFGNGKKSGRQKANSH